MEKTEKRIIGDWEQLNTLYFLRESAQKVLRGEGEEKQNLCLYMGELSGVVEQNGVSSETLKRVFDEVMPEVLDKLAAYQPDAEILAKQKFMQNDRIYALFGKNNCEAFKAAQDALNEAKNDLQKLTDKKVVSRGSKTVTQDEATVLALKEEICRWIQSTKKIASDEGKAAALQKLDNAEKLTVSAKNNQISVDFGMADVKAVFSVVANGIRFEEANLVSKFGGLQDILGVKEAQKFAQKLAGHKKGKDYLTAKGKTIENAEKTLKNTDKRKADNIKEQKEALRRVGAAQKKIVEVYQKMVREANPVWAWQNLVKPQIEKGNAELIDIMAQRVLASNALWGLYLEKENTGANGERKNDTRSYYGKLTESVMTSTQTTPYIKTVIESGYQQFVNNGEKGTCVQLVFSKVYNKMPQKLRKEIVNQVILDMAFQFGMNSCGKVPEDKKIEFMNGILATHNINIGFERKNIEEKCAETRLNDIIHEKDGPVKTYKKKMTALLYDMGKIIGDSATETKIRDISLNPDLRKRFAELNVGNWEAFARDADNVLRAKETKKLIDEEYGQKAEGIIAAMREGREVEQDSLHHVIYAYYAPLFGNDKEKLVEQFNAKDNTVEVLCGHPAFRDMHKEVEHRFNISSGGTVLVERNGNKMYKTSNTAQVGDVLLMPVIKVRENGEKPFERLMSKGQLFMTSSGKTVSDPYGPGGGNTLFKGLYFNNNNDGR